MFFVTLPLRFQEVWEAFRGMAISFAGKRDFTINPPAAVAAVLVLFWGTVAILWWRFF